MKTTEEILATLSKYEVESDWRDKVLWRRNNRYWLRYSQYMAMIVLDRLDELGLTQKQLAERMGCSAQYVSKIMKGWNMERVNNSVQSGNFVNFTTSKNRLL